jgi:hypothetical protein
MITVIDFEASGLGSDTYPIQVAWNIGNTVFSHYINPDHVPAWQHWSEQAELVHGIEREYLTRCGKHPRDVASIMNRLLHGRTVYSDAVSFDRAWCERLFTAAGMKMDFTFDHLWLGLAPLIPSTIREQGGHAICQWFDDLKQEAIRRVALPAHKADHDVRILLEVIRLAKAA